MDEAILLEEFEALERELDSDHDIHSEDPLIPEKWPQKDLFICDVADAVLKDIIPTMEHPFYSLSKKPDMKVRRYEHRGNWLEITPSYKGMATIYDKDILIYAVSQVMAKLKNYKEVYRVINGIRYTCIENIRDRVGSTIRISAREILMFTNRGTSGSDYDALVDALERLDGTRIKTNIVVEDEQETDFIGFLRRATIRRKFGGHGRLLWVDITLSDWILDAIEERQVLTLHRDYFRLSKPTERRIYELARKHCGHKQEWEIGTSMLHKKSGSQGNIRLFRQALKKLAEHNHLPDYRVEFGESEDKVKFINRKTWWPKEGNNELAKFSPDIVEAAKKVAPAYDVYYLEQLFREWWAKSCRPAPKDLKAAFVGFCRKVQARQSI